MRLLKDKKEIELIAGAEELGCEVFRRIMPFIKPGAGELEIANEIKDIGRRLGAEKISFEPIVGSGANSSKPHSFPTPKKLENGDFVTIDMGFIYHGYSGDMTRTMVIGEPTEKQIEIYNIVLEAQIAGVNAAIAGITAAQLDHISRSVIEKYGYGKEFMHILGHGVGLTVHEDPILNKGNEMILKSGMIVTIEPGIYIEGWGGVRIEDLILIEENGCRVLSKSSPKNLIKVHS
jgi:Xaa-Pro aminopeptidase